MPIDYLFDSVGFTDRTVNFLYVAECLSFFKLIVLYLVDSLFTWRSKLKVWCLQVWHCLQIGSPVFKYFEIEETLGVLMTYNGPGLLRPHNVVTVEKLDLKSVFASQWLLRWCKLA